MPILTEEGQRALSDYYAWQYRDRPPFAICPICAALVPNDFPLIDKHAAWHQVMHDEDADVSRETSEEASG